eukprot:364612-Chlamydomonas_euryale.AAC.2
MPPSTRTPPFLSEGVRGEQSACVAPWHALSSPCHAPTWQSAHLRFSGRSISSFSTGHPLRHGAQSLTQHRRRLSTGADSARPPPQHKRRLSTNADSARPPPQHKRRISTNADSAHMPRAQPGASLQRRDQR